jgi:hypothetical protein
VRTKIFAASCVVLFGLSAAHAEEEFIFRARKAPRAVKVKTTSPEQAEPSAQGVYEAREGDTLWDVAGRFWRSPYSWPELWALNPHFRNPHRIDPGDPIFLTRGGRGDEIHLPVAQPESDVAQNPATAGIEAAPAASHDIAQKPSPVLIRTARAQAGHFVSSHRIARVGSLSEQPIPKSIFTTGDDVSVALSGDAHLKPGDLATIFDDSLPLVHPVNGTPQGYLVRVLGHLRVHDVSGGRAIGKILEAYDEVPNGAGVMAYRKPLEQITPGVARADVQGVVLSGMPGQTLLGTEDVLFLDRGTLHGLKVGDVLNVPIPRTNDFFSSGVTDLERPIARILVISVQDKSATGLVLASRETVMAGQRFVASALSP